jgi:hypothetical protein
MRAPYVAKQSILHGPEGVGDQHNGRQSRVAHLYWQLNYLPKQRIDWTQVGIQEWVHPVFHLGDQNPQHQYKKCPEVL